MTKNFIVLLLLITSSISLHSQNNSLLGDSKFGNLVDKIFLDENPENYAIRLFGNYKIKSFRISNDTYKSRYIPRNKNGIGIGFSSSKSIIDLAFNIKGGNEEVTKKLDIQGTAIVNNRNYVNFHFQNYKGYTIKNNYGAPKVFRDDIQSISAGVNFLHTFSDIEFSYAMLRTGIDREDKKVYVTTGLGAFCFYDSFSADDSVIADNADLLFNDQAHITDYKSTSFGVLGGVISLYKLPKDFVISATLMPGLGVIYNKVTLVDDAYKPSNRLLFKMDYNLAIGRDFDRFYTSFIYGGGVYKTKLGYDNDYRFNLTNAKLAFGYKLFAGRKK